ncbi:GNAT family N-acetyltransferase [Halosolutus halophilus]|uniref:GNAT family N-acetyltransferase n=1 Tax=Halosolutus halophilus TaxID=1552990 RepID=UPI00223510BC|nr:GNAT family N-acetyltransferase [Halosolutus halophilus]
MAQIRRARAADREGISRTHLASIRGVDSTAYDETELAVWEAGASSVSYPIDDPETEFLVAESDDEIAGFAEASLDDPELDKLYVAPAYQHQRIATALAEEIERSLRSTGADSVYVEAAPNAAPFYERIGYERVGTHRKAITSDSSSAEMTVVDMEKEL